MSEYGQNFLVEEDLKYSREKIKELQTGLEFQKKRVEEDLKYSREKIKELQTELEFQKKRYADLFNYLASLKIILDDMVNYYSIN